MLINYASLLKNNAKRIQNCNMNNEKGTDWQLWSIFFMHLGGEGTVTVVSVWGGGNDAKCI